MGVHNIRGDKQYLSRIWGMLRTLIRFFLGGEGIFMKILEGDNKLLKKGWGTGLEPKTLQHYYINISTIKTPKLQV